jgi:hypothetical protein
MPHGHHDVKENFKVYKIISCFQFRYYYDGWSIVEGVYFLWICMSTVGFGDYIINNGKPYYDGNLVKTLMLRFNVIFLIIGLCQVSCILVSIQNAIETKFVEKVGQDESNDDVDNESETSAKNETNERNGKLGEKNEAYELEIVDEGGCSKISETSLNTL